MPYYCTRLLAAAARVFTIVLAAVASNVNKNHVTAIGQKKHKGLACCSLEMGNLRKVALLGWFGDLYELLVLCNS